MYPDNEIAQQANGPEWWVVLLYVIAAVSILITVWSIWLYPMWRVWAAHKEGLADLARAKNEQAIQIAQAQARYDAAELNKKAAIIEAEAVAAQIKEIGDGLKQHDLYLRWQWIKMMEERDGDETIYVPTEANLPVLEATRFMRQDNG